MSMNTINNIIIPLLKYAYIKVIISGSIHYPLPMFISLGCASGNKPGLGAIYMKHLKIKMKVLMFQPPCFDIYS